MARPRKPNPHQDVWDEVWAIKHGTNEGVTPQTASAIPPLEALRDRLQTDGIWSVDTLTASMLLSSLAGCYMLVGEWQMALGTWDQIEYSDAPTGEMKATCLWKLGRLEEAEAGFRNEFKSEWRRSAIWRVIALWEDDEPDKDRLMALIQEGLSPSLAKRANNVTIEEIKNLLRTGNKRTT